MLIVRAALTVKANKGTPPANRSVYLGIRIDHVRKVTDDDVLWVHTNVLEDIELLKRRLPRNAGMGEDRNVCRKVRATDGSEYLALILGDVVPRTDLAVSADRIGLRLADQHLGDRLLAHGADLSRVERMRIEAATCHDGQP